MRNLPRCYYEAIRLPNIRLLLSSQLSHVGYECIRASIIILLFRGACGGAIHSH